MTENEALAGDLLTACTLLAAEKELADDLADVLANSHPNPVIERVLARYRKARQR